MPLLVRGASAEVRRDVTHALEEVRISPPDRDVMSEERRDVMSHPCVVQFAGLRERRDVYTCTGCARIKVIINKSRGRF